MEKSSHTYSDGSKYKGEMKDGKRHGHGAWTRPDGTMYVGEWENDKPNGQGILTLPSGKKYVGKWRNGRRHGEGVEIRQDGNKLYGIWANGKLVDVKKPISVHKVNPVNLEEFGQQQLVSSRLNQDEMITCQKEIKTTETTWQCKACLNELPTDAVKCSNCFEWREDIKRERNLTHLWAFITTLPIFALIYGWANRWWPPMPASANEYGMWRFLVGPIPGSKAWLFDWNTFFTSTSGLIIIVSFCIALSIYLKYYISASKKMSNWIWF